MKKKANGPLHQRVFLNLCLQPVYLTSLVPYDTTEEEETGGVEEEEGGAVEEQEGEETEAPDAASEGGNGNNNENGRDGGRAKTDKSPPLRFRTYKEAVKKYYLHHTDNNMVGRFRNQDTQSFTRGKM